MEIPEHSSAGSTAVSEAGDGPQRAMIKRARAVFADDERILAGWLVGSFATGDADAYSDVDLACLITDESVDWFTEHWADVAADIAGPLVLASTLPGMIGGYTLTPDWVHLDLVIHPRSGTDPRTIPVLTPLYDSTGDLLPDRRASVDAPASAPYFPAATVNLFFYFLGNLVVTLGRGELIVAHGGIIALREGLIELMLAERGVRRTGGQKRLNRFLSDEQRTVLEALPAAATIAPDIVNSCRYVTVAFLRRGHALAQTTGAHWPHNLEDATLGHLHRNLGVDFQP